MLGSLQKQGVPLGGPKNGGIYDFGCSCELPIRLPVTVTVWFTCRVPFWIPVSIYKLGWGSMERVHCV